MVRKYIGAIDQAAKNVELRAKFYADAHMARKDFLENDKGYHADDVHHFLLSEFPQAALQTIELIQEAVNILRHHPLICREVDQYLRELVISRGQSGYIALYSYESVL